MKFANMGSADRFIRLIVGLGIIAAVFLSNVVDPSTPIGVGALVVAAVFIVTSAFAFCPAYLPFGFRTRRES